MLQKNIPLNKVALNVLSEISEVRKGFENYSRLIELGFTEGSEVVPIHFSPSGDPTAYCIRGCVIALREEDAKNIIVNIKEV